MANGDRRPTKGGDALSRCADSHAEVAGKVGVDKSLVTRWISGARRPAEAQQAKLLELYSIPLEAWTTPATAAKPGAKSPAKKSEPPPASSPPVIESGPGHKIEGVFEDVGEDAPDAGRLHRFIRKGLRELETSDLPANKRAETMKKLVDAKVALDRSTGENALTMSRIAQHPEFQRVVRLIVEAIAPHPEVLAKVLEILKANP